MSLKKWQFERNAKKGGFLLAAGFLVAHRAEAASVIMSPPPLVTTPQVAQEDATNNDMNVFVPAGVVNPDTTDPFQYGPVNVRPHVSYNILYGTGIQSSASTSENTLVQSFAPGITTDLGRHWTVDYTPTLNFYSSDKLRDGVDHAASLNGVTHYGDWNFNLSQNFSATSDPLTETGAQTDQQAYNTALGASYLFNDKWTATFAVNQAFLFVSHLQNSYDWSTLEGVNYQFFPRLSAGVSLGAGYTKITDNSGSGADNPDTVDEQMNLNLSWRATDKISFQGSVGFEDQQFLANGYDDSLNPIFSASVQYQPFSVTQISLTGSRTVGASDYYTAAQSTEITTVSLSLNQRILVKYNLTLSVGYNKADYTSTYTFFGYKFGTTRSDDEYTFDARFGRNFLKRGNWAIVYHYGDNASDQSGFSQRSHQIGFQISYNY